MKQLIGIVGIVFLLLSIAHSYAAQAFSPEEQTLVDRNSEQLKAYELQHDDESASKISHPKFMIVIGAGIVESLDMVVGTSSNLDIESWDETVLDVRIIGNTAIIISRVDLVGTMLGIPLPERQVYTHTYVRESVEAEWRLLQRNITPITVPEPLFQLLLTEALAEK